MSQDNVELVFCDTDGLPDVFRKSRKGSIYLTPYRVSEDVSCEGGARFSHVTVISPR